MTTYPHANEKQLVVYALGPGFGESVVVLTPDGDTIVVDACTSGGNNLTAMLLHALGRSTIDLLVFSHPDTDHVRGGAELLASFDPKRIWTYPLAVSLRTRLAQLMYEDPSYPRTKLVDVRALLEALEPFRERNVAEDVQSNTMRWSSRRSACHLQAIAPLQNDVDAASRQILKLVTKTKRGPEVSERVVNFLAGIGDAGDHPNTVSIALSLSWSDQRVLLAGDVEQGRTTHSGWRGIVDLLTRRNSLDWIRRMRVVKVAHHGSDNAYDERAWELHAEGGAAPVAMICPFSKSGELPTRSVLTSLRTHSSRLAISAVSPEIRRRVGAAGWKANLHTTAHDDWPLPVVAAVVPRHGRATVHVARGAGGWSAT